MIHPTSSPAMLVQAALSAAQDESVRVSVHHRTPGQAPPRPAPAPPATRGPAGPGGDGEQAEVESFRSDVCGWGFEIRTRRLRVPAARAWRREDDAAPVPDLLDGRRRAGWSGTTPLNGFSSGIASRLDVLLTFRRGVWYPDPAEAARLTEAFGELTLATTRSLHPGGAGATVRTLPIFLVRSPAAGFTDAQWDALPGSGDPRPPQPGRPHDDPQLSRAACLRMTVSLDEARPGDRVGFLDDVLRFARERQYGLHVADRRFGALQGQWIMLAPVGRPGPRPRPEDGAPPSLTGAVAQVSVVGPTRVGSYRAIAETFVDGEVPLAAVSCTPLNEVDLVHALTPLDDRIRARVVPPDAARPDGPDGRAAGPGPLPDYLTLVDTLAAPRTEVSESHPVWVSWTMRDTPAEHPPDETALRVLGWMRGHHDLVAACRVDYHRLQRPEPLRRVERLKLSVTLAAADLYRTPQALGERLLLVCEEMQDDFRFVRPSSGRVTAFRASARERWLGTWLDDPV